MKRYRRQRLNVPKPNQAWHARHRTCQDSWYQLARYLEESGNPKTSRKEGKWCSSHASTTATCEQRRPKQGEGKDQASDTYKWLPCTWKWELSLADSPGAELTSMTSQSILPEVRGSISHWRCANTTGSHTLHPDENNIFLIVILTAVQSAKNLFCNKEVLL